MTTKQGFKEIEHTADAALHVWGRTLTEMFQQAALGIYSLAGAQVDDSSPIHRSIHLEADDLETLLVNFLSELLFFLDEGFLFQVTALQIKQNKLDGELSGSGITRIQEEIKAVTFHDLQIIRSENGFQTNIVLDI